MISKCILTMEERAEITQFARQSEWNKRLLDILSDRSSNIYNDCIAALRTAEPNYTDLVQRTERMNIEKTSIYEPQLDMRLKVYRWKKNTTLSIGWFVVLKATFSNISVILRWPVLLVEKAEVPGENHWSVASQWQTVSHNDNVVSITLRHERGWNSQL